MPGGLEPGGGVGLGPRSQAVKVFLDQLDGGTHLIADHTGPGRHGHRLLLVDWRAT